MHEPIQNARRTNPRAKHTNNIQTSCKMYVENRGAVSLKTRP